MSRRAGTGVPDVRGWITIAMDAWIFLSPTMSVTILAKIPKAGASENCNWKGIAVNCGPRGLPTTRPRLYHNNGDGTFTDVSERSGVAGATGSYGLTAVTADLDDDGWPDIYMAGDSTPSFFFHNRKNGTFREEAILRGVALSEDGMEQAGMGVALGDYQPRRKHRYI